MGVGSGDPLHDTGVGVEVAVGVDRPGQGEALDAKAGELSNDEAEKYTLRDEEESNEIKLRLIDDVAGLLAVSMRRGPVTVKCPSIKFHK